MEKPEHHIFVCMSFRGLEPKGKCIKKNAPELLGYLESELADRGMDNVMVSSTGCLKLCENGPMVVVYPNGYWYPGVEGEDAIDAILDALEERRPGQGVSDGLMEDFIYCHVPPPVNINPSGYHLRAGGG